MSSSSVQTRCRSDASSPGVAACRAQASPPRRIERRRLKQPLLTLQNLRQPQPILAEQLLRSAGGSRQTQGHGTAPEVTEAGRVTGHRQIEMLANLTLQQRRLLHQVAPMPRQHPQRNIRLGQLQLDQAESLRGRAMHGRQIVGVRLVSRIGRQSKLLGGESAVGGHQPRVKARLHERSPRGLVIVPGSFDHDQHILNATLLHDAPHPREHGVQMRPIMLDRLRLDQDLSQKNRHHPPRPLLSGIDTHDPKLLHPDLGDSRRDHPTRLLQHPPRRLPPPRLPGSCRPGCAVPRSCHCVRRSCNCVTLLAGHLRLLGLKGKALVTSQ